MRKKYMLSHGTRLGYAMSKQAFTWLEGQTSIITKIELLNAGEGNESSCTYI
jgi:hypothetical protein